MSKKAMKNAVKKPAKKKVTSRKAKNPSHKVASREQWLSARKKLLVAEKAHTRRGDELARMRQELPWVRVEKDYVFDTEEGKASLADLFRGNSQLLIYHFMFGPDYTAGCPSCSSIADGFNGVAVHLANHDVTLGAVSRAPLAKLRAFKKRMGWSFPWASSFKNDFNYDFQVGNTDGQAAVGQGDLQLQAEGRGGVGAGGAGESHACRHRGDHRHGLADLHPGDAGHERLRAEGRRRLPHLLGLLARAGWALGHVPVARPRAARAQ